MSGPNRPTPRNLVPTDWIALLLVALLPFVVYMGSLRAALDVRQDDHRIIFFSQSERPLHDQVLSAQDKTGRTIQPTVAYYLSSDAKDQGRFRPLPQVMEVMLSRILGTDSFRWHLMVLLLASLNAVALFLIGYRIGGSWVEGAAMALLVVLAPDPGPAKVWYLMSVKVESFGTLFVSLAVLASIRAARPSGRTADDVLALALVVAAMLTKEPFALLLPGLLAIRLSLPRCFGYVTAWRDTPRSRQVVIGYLIVGVLYAAAIGLLLAIAPADSYGTRSLHDPEMLRQGFLLTMAHVPLQAAWFAPTLLAMAVLFRQRGFREMLLAFRLPLALTLIWVVPQILLYASRGGMWDHYWLPCILGFAGLNAWSLRLLRLARHRFAYALALVLLSAWLVNGVRTNVPAVTNYVERTLMRIDAVRALAKNVPPHGRVVIVADFKTYSEYAASWVYFAGNEGRPHTRYLLYDVTKRRSAMFSKAMYFPYSIPLDQLKSCDVDAIVFLDLPVDTDLDWKRWYRSDCFEVKSFIRPQEYFSVRELGMVRQTAQLDLAFNRALRQAAPSPERRD